MDYDKGITMTGGLVVAAGSSEMAQAPGTTSTIRSILVTFSLAKTNGSIFHIETSYGTEILSYTPTKNYQSVAFASPALTNGRSYKIYLNGSSSGTSTDGIFEGGIYSPVTEYKGFTISGVLIRVN